MRRIYTRYSHFALALLLLCFGIGCETKEDGTPIDENRTIEIDFTATTGDLNNPILNTSDKPVIIFQGESVTFQDISMEVIQDLSTGQKKETPYTDEVNWVFEGGDPMTFTGGGTTVVYNIAGPHDVTMKTMGITGFAAVDSTFIDYVQVILKPKSRCRLTSEEISNGQKIDYTYRTSDFFALLRADFLLDEVSVGYNTYDYNNTGMVETISSMDVSDQLVRKRVFDYNANGNNISDITEDPEGNVLFEANYTWNDGLAIKATFMEPDGLGGTLMLEANYTYRPDRHNVFRVDFLIDGIGIGYELHEHDQSEKVHTGLSSIENAPFKFNLYNVTSITSYDTNDNKLKEVIRSWDEYNPNFCDRGTMLTESAEGEDPLTYRYTFQKEFED